jgi:hypothetical protein
MYRWIDLCRGERARLEIISIFWGTSTGSFIPFPFMMSNDRAEVET